MAANIGIILRVSAPGGYVPPNYRSLGSFLSQHLGTGAGMWLGLLRIFGMPSCERDDEKEEEETLSTG